MAKMFYSLEEAAQKLGMDVDDVKALTESGQLQEFRDQDKIMLKVEQVDLLAGDNDDSGGMIPLADSGEIEPISMSSSGSAPAMEGDPDQTGVSIFDPEDEDDADPAAATQVSPSLGGFADFGDAAASGSGLANLALEGDDTSLGADLLDDVYSSTGSGSMAAPAGSGMGGSAMGSGIMDGGGDLFESAGTTPEPIGAAPAMAGAGLLMPDAYDGAGSGLVGGIASLRKVRKHRVGLGRSEFAHLLDGAALLALVVLERNGFDQLTLLAVGSKRLRFGLAVAVELDLDALERSGLALELVVPDLAADQGLELELQRDRGPRRNQRIAVLGLAVDLPGEARPLR